MLVASLRGDLRSQPSAQLQPNLPTQHVGHLLGNRLQRSLRGALLRELRHSVDRGWIQHLHSGDHDHLFVQLSLVGNKVDERYRKITNILVILPTNITHL